MEVGDFVVTGDSDLDIVTAMRGNVYSCRHTDTSYSVSTARPVDIRIGSKLYSKTKNKIGLVEGISTRRNTIILVIDFLQTEFPLSELQMVMPDCGLSAGDTIRLIKKTGHAYIDKWLGKDFVMKQTPRNGHYKTPRGHLVSVKNFELVTSANEEYCVTCGGTGRIDDPGCGYACPRCLIPEPEIEIKIVSLEEHHAMLGGAETTADTKDPGSYVRPTRAQLIADLLTC